MHKRINIPKKVKQMEKDSELARIETDQRIKDKLSGNGKLSSEISLAMHLMGKEKYADRKLGIEIMTNLLNRIDSKRLMERVVKALSKSKYGRESLTIKLKNSQMPKDRRKIIKKHIG